MIRSVLIFSALSALLCQRVEALGKLWGHLKPKSFSKGDPIDMHVGQLWSLVAGTLPYDFYSLRWCDSTEGHQYDNTLLRQNKTFDDNNDDINTIIHESPYTYTVGESQDSMIACNRIMTRN